MQGLHNYVSSNYVLSLQISIDCMQSINDAKVKSVLLIPNPFKSLDMYLLC